MLEIEKERAKERQGERTDLDEHSGNVSKKSEEPAREKAAEKIDAGVSGRTLEKERAKERQEELGRNQGQDPSGNVSQRGDNGRAREKAAEKIDAGISGRTLQHFVGFRRARVK